jgi:hypothetical protein
VRFQRKWDFGLKVSTKRLLPESQTILFTPIWYHTKLPKLVFFGVKEAMRLSPEQIILSRATWYDLGELSHVTSTLPCAKVDIYSRFHVNEVHITHNLVET